MAKRFIRFLISGGVATAASYLSFMGLLALGLHYLVACTGSWVLAVCVGFAMNRRFTYSIAGAAGRGRHFLLFAIGAVLQLGLALEGYSVLIGQLGLSPSLAFIANAALTATFGFIFMNLVTFRDWDAKRD